MIAERLKFSWNISEERVSFSVCEDPLHVMWFRYWSRGKFPPLCEKIKYYRLAGKDERFIKSLIKFHNREKKRSEKNQQALDSIFSKYNIKPTKKKELKPVKKKS